MDSVRTLFRWLAAFVSVGNAVAFVPQLRLVLTEGVTSGVSAATYGTFAAMGIIFALHLALERNWYLFFGTILATVQAGLIACLVTVRWSGL